MRACCGPKGVSRRTTLSGELRPPETLDEESRGELRVVTAGRLRFCYRRVRCVVSYLPRGQRGAHRQRVRVGCDLQPGKGALTGKGPGLFFLVPIRDKMVKVDLRTVTMDVPPQYVITRDNVPARVNAIVYFRVIDPNRAVVDVENYVLATSQISQTTLRSVLGQKDLDDLLTNREAINEELQTIIDEHTEPWGVKVSAVEVKDVEIPQQMQRAMARQAESEQERRAKIIAAEGEYQAS